MPSAVPVTQYADGAVGRRPLQPADRQQQADHDHRAGHGVAEAGQPHHGARDGIAAAPQAVGQQQRDGHGQHGADAAQPHAVAGPLQEAVPGQHRPVGRQRPQHEQHRQHEAQQHRQRAQRPRPPGARRPRSGTGWASAEPARPPREAAKRMRRCARCSSASSTTTTTSSSGRELGGGDAVVHRQPGLVDAGGEGLDAEVAGHAEVGQRLHQRQRHAGGHRRARQRQRHPQRRACAAARPAGAPPPSAARRARPAPCAPAGTHRGTARRRTPRSRPAGCAPRATARPSRPKAARSPVCSGPLNCRKSV